MLWSFADTGVPVRPMNLAFGNASRMSRPSRPSWVRCASSTITTMLRRSLRRPASAKRKIVVTMTPRTSVASSLTQVVAGVGRLERRYASGGELAGDLLDEVEAVEHDQDGGSVELKLAPQLAGGEGHQEGLAGSLVVPDRDRGCGRARAPERRWR